MNPFFWRLADTLLGELPYCPKVSNVSEIIYCTDGLSEGKTYMVWHNMRYAAGYVEPRIGGDRRRLSTSELEQIDRYFRNNAFKTSIHQGLTVSSAMETTLANPRIVI